MLGKLSAVKWETSFFFFDNRETRYCRPDWEPWTGTIRMLATFFFFLKLGCCVTWNRINSGLVGHISTLRSAAGLMSTKCCVQLCIYSAIGCTVSTKYLCAPTMPIALYFFGVFDSTQFVFNCSFQPPKLLMLHKSYISVPLIFVSSLK
jgi:hypothetical protein